jgi:hypothetical protein
MNIWYKLIVLVLFLACFCQEALAAPKKTTIKTPAKKTTTKEPANKKASSKGKKTQKREEEEE